MSMKQIIIERWKQYVNKYPAWHEIIAHEDRKTFLKQEAIYCNEELREFQKYDWDGDDLPPDSVRKAVLDKRVEYLKHVVKKDLFRFKVNAPLDKLR